MPPLQAELSRFVGIFMVATNLLTVVLCLAFFGDQAGGIVLGWTSGEQRRRQKKETTPPTCFLSWRRGWRQSSEFTYPVQTVQKACQEVDLRWDCFVSRLDQVPVTREMSSQWPAGHTFLEFLRISILHFVWHLASEPMVLSRLQRERNFRIWSRFTWSLNKLAVTNDRYWRHAWVFSMFSLEFSMACVFCQTPSHRH